MRPVQFYKKEDLSMFNQSTIIGKIKKDPLYNLDKKGVPICSFFLETKEHLYDADLKANIVERQLHTIVCFGALATSVSTRLKAGDLIVAQGRIVTNFYFDDMNNKRAEINVKLQRFYLIKEFDEETIY